VGGAANQSECLEILPASLAEFRKYFDDLRYGLLPKPSRFVNFVMSRVDPTRAPEGKAVFMQWQYVPYFLADGGPAKWDSIKEEVSNQSMEAFFSHTTNLSSKNVLGKKVLSPLDLTRINQNNVNGQVLGPAPYLYQNLAYRPVPELGQYRTPVEGLYGGGQSYHPGGGITLGGRATAQIIMQDLGIDFDDVVG
jgi:phytoene dehydrogenase-like protein